MILLQVAFHGSVSTLRFENLEKAATAYQTIKDALGAYKLYTNDRAESVEVETENGKSTFRLERMDSVIMEDAGSFDARLRKVLEEEKIARAMRAEMGLPEINPNANSPVSDDAR